MSHVAVSSIGQLSMNLPGGSIPARYGPGLWWNRPRPNCRPRRRSVGLLLPTTVVLDDMDEHVATTFERAVDSLGASCSKAAGNRVTFLRAALSIRRTRWFCASGARPVSNCLGHQNVYNRPHAIRSFAGLPS